MRESRPDLLRLRQVRIRALLYVVTP